ncbi:DUF4416 family protein [candidate division WOR-3 bacterium]|nr:DUF4416 family protein [candidate division WOR-3 bacterium]
MAGIRDPRRVMPVVGLIWSGDLKADIGPELEDILGRIVLKSASRPFDHTPYYNKEMGDQLTRQWWAFGDLVMPDRLVEFKHRTNATEKKYLNAQGGRHVNIDPGLLSLSNLVLASTKNYAHRICLGQGIYAEVTLLYKHKGFVPLEWTYLDYREASALEFFTRARGILREDLTRSEDV